MLTFFAAALFGAVTYATGIGATYGYLMKRRKWEDNHCAHGDFCGHMHNDDKYDGPAGGSAKLLAAVWPLVVLGFVAFWVLHKPVLYLLVKPFMKAYQFMAKPEQPKLPEAKVVKE